jgi:MurNAc alpha-1-phosphate uridylyltransferase
MPKRAMVLAAGLGLRMRPVTLETPKPLIAVGGQSMLDHALDRLDDAGVEQAVVNTHWLGDKIAAHLAARRRGPKTIVSHETELLETAGGIVQALPHLGDAPFFVVNSDIVWLDGPTPALTRMARLWDPDRMDVLLLLMPTVWAVGYEGPGDYHLDPMGRCRLRKANELAPFIAAGVSIAKPELYRDLPPGKRGNLEIWKRAEAEGRLFGLRHDGAWYHVGTPDAIAEVDDQLQAPAVRWAEP